MHALLCLCHIHKIIIVHFVVKSQHNIFVMVTLKIFIALNTYFTHYYSVVFNVYKIMIVIFYITYAL